jgi:hypothetical protein
MLSRSMTTKSWFVPAVGVALVAALIGVFFLGRATAPDSSRPSWPQVSDRDGKHRPFSGPGRQRSFREFQRRGDSGRWIERSGTSREGQPPAREPRSGEPQPPARGGAQRLPSERGLAAPGSGSSSRDVQPSGRPRAAQPSGRGSGAKDLPSERGLTAPGPGRQSR